MVTKNLPALPGSRLMNFYRDASSALLLTTRQPMVIIDFTTTVTFLIPRFNVYLLYTHPYVDSVGEGDCKTFSFLFSFSCSADHERDGHQVCVCMCFLRIHSGHQVRWTYQPGSHRRKVTQEFSSAFILRYAP